MSVAAARMVLSLIGLVGVVLIILLAPTAFLVGLAIGCAVAIAFAIVLLALAYLFVRAFGGEW